MKTLNTIKGDLIQLGKDNEFDKLADEETVRGDAGKLGTYTIGMGGRLLILNAYTQYTVSYNGRDVFEYNAFERVLNKISTRFGKWRIGLPLIGMGLAGGDKEKIMPLIEYFSQTVERQGGSVTLVEWERS